MERRKRNKGALRCLTTLIFPPAVTTKQAKIACVLFIPLLGNALTLSLVFSYLPRLIQDFNISEINIGTYAGIVASSIFVGWLIGSYIWGSFADRYSRKLALSLSTALLSIFTLLNGFTWNIEYVIFARFMQGLVNGIVIASKAAIADITDNKTQGTLMSFVLSGFSFGLVMGPAFGGFLSLPHEKYPNLFSEDSLFGKYPYLLPNFINFIILVIGFLCTCFYLPATLNRSEFIPQENTSLVKGNEQSSYDESPNKSKSTDTQGNCDTPKSYEWRQHSGSYKTFPTKEKIHDNVTFMPSKKVEEGGTIKILQSIFNKSFQNQDKEDNETCCRCCFPGKRSDKMDDNSTFLDLLRGKKSRVSLLLFAMHSFVDVAVIELVPVFAGTQRRYDGLEFSTNQIGTLILTQTFPAIIVMVWLFPKAESRFGSRKLFIGALYCIIFSVPLIPCVSKLPRNGYLWAVTIIVLCVFRIGSNAAFLSINLFLNNAVEENAVGKINGLALASSSFFRALAPTVIGSIYSWSLTNRSIGFPVNYNFPFLIISLMSLISIFVFVTLPDSIERKKMSHYESFDSIP